MAVILWKVCSQSWPLADIRELWFQECPHRPWNWRVVYYGLNWQMLWFMMSQCFPSGNLGFYVEGGFMARPQWKPDAEASVSTSWQHFRSRHTSHCWENELHAVTPLGQHSRSLGLVFPGPCLLPFPLKTVFGSFPVTTWSCEYLWWYIESSKF